MAASSLPSRVFRTELLYRSAPWGPAAAAVDCGFMLKPDGRGAYRDRRMPRYVGVFVLRGSGAHIDPRGRSHRVEAGCFIQHPPGLLHSLVPDADGRWAEFFFQAPAPLYRALVDLGSVSGNNPVLRTGLDAGLIQGFEALMDLGRRTPGGDAPRMLVHVHELLVTLHRLDAQRRQPHPHADAVTQACAWLGRDLHRDLDLTDLAQRLNLSYERFRKVFRDRVGVPPGEYRIRRRIDRARTLIAQDRLSNKEAAYRLGYPDPFTFSKQFKRYVGLSPDAFRRTV